MKTLVHLVTKKEYAQWVTETSYRRMNRACGSFSGEYATLVNTLPHHDDQYAACPVCALLAATNPDLFFKDDLEAELFLEISGLPKVKDGADV